MVGALGRRPRVQILLPAIRWICVWWSQIQLQPPASWDHFLTSFCLVYNVCLVISASKTLEHAALNTSTLN